MEVTLELATEEDWVQDEKAVSLVALSAEEEDFKACEEANEESVSEMEVTLEAHTVMEARKS